MSINHITRTEINIGERTVPLVARINKRAKRLILKVDPIAGEIIVTAPSKRALPEAISFAKDRQDWIASQMDDGLRARPFSEGMCAPYCGENYQIRRAGGPRTPIQIQTMPDRILFVGGEATHLNRRVVDWMKREARMHLTKKADEFCARLNKTRRAIRIRDTRSCWGSCSSDGSLSFSWRLIMAPVFVQDYVAAHECAHLEHMDHSPAFWRKVATLGVDARAAKTWFDRYGASLFSYGAIVR